VSRHPDARRPFKEEVGRHHVTDVNTRDSSMCSNTPRSLVPLNQAVDRRICARVSYIADLFLRVFSRAVGGQTCLTGLMTDSSIEGASGASPARSPLVERAQRHIWNNLDQPLRWRQVAAASGCSSPRTLNSTFVRETGETIKEHVVRVRMLVAMADIRAGIKIAAVALCVGYRSRANFTAAFRAAYGSNPRTFAPSANEKLRSMVLT
jgi:AraC-like DNA-binding protein